MTVNLNPLHCNRNVSAVRRLLRSWRAVIGAYLIVVAPLLCPADELSATTAGPTPGQQKMLSLLENKVKSTPHHSDSWRSLGKLQLALGDHTNAMQSVRRAILEDEFNAAAHYDLGQMLTTSRQPEEARSHFDRVFEIAPSSSYATQLQAANIQPRSVNRATLLAPNTSAMASVVNADSLPAPGLNSSLMQLAGYEIQSFDGADDTVQRMEELRAEALAPANRLRVFMETGVLYNSNVSLTPVSRELAQSDGGSFQGFTNPDLDWKLLQTERLRAGPLFRGYFTINEDKFSNFDLASYQPGAFFERDFQLGQSQAIGRIDYVFTADFFDGDAVDNRHSATTSLTLIRPDLDAIYLYLTLASSDFADDGVDPAQTSLDGTTFTVGASRFFQTGWENVPMHSLGIDLSSADTDGADYRYQAINLHGSTGWNLSPKWKLIPTWGVGWRDYLDFTGPMGREELFWRVHGRLQYQFNSLWSMALVCGHDRFASDNEDFDTQRTEGGVVLTFTR